MVLEYQGGRYDYAISVVINRCFLFFLPSLPSLAFPRVTFPTVDLILHESPTSLAIHLRALLTSSRVNPISCHGPTNCMLYAATLSMSASACRTTWTGLLRGASRPRAACQIKIIIKVGLAVAATWGPGLFADGIQHSRARIEGAGMSYGRLGHRAHRTPSPQDADVARHRQLAVLVGSLASWPLHC